MIDLHCHVDLFPKPREVIDGAIVKGVFVVSVTTTPSAWPGTSGLAQCVPEIETALGLHPQLALERISELGIFDLHLPKVTWVGEVGLDGSPELRPFWSTQVKVFEHILRSCSSAGGRILSIHSRRAALPVLDCLKNHPDAGVPVLHWFSGTTRDLELALGCGCWFSVGSPMLTSKKGRELVARIPRSRILTETDAPFTEINGRPSYPWDVVLAEHLLGEIWGVSDEEVRALVAENLWKLQGSLRTGS